MVPVVDHGGQARVRLRSRARAGGRVPRAPRAGGPAVAGRLVQHGARGDDEHAGQSRLVLVDVPRQVAFVTRNVFPSCVQVRVCILV